MKIPRIINIRTHELQLTSIILFLLIFIRFLYTFIFFTKNENIWLESLYLCLSYCLITIIFFLNRSNLNKFNLDRISFILFIVGFGIYSFFLVQPMGIILSIAVIFNLNLLLSKDLVFARVRINQTILLLVLLFAIVQLGFYFLFVDKLQHNIGQNFISDIFRANFALVFLEELIFRGIFWKSLEDRKLVWYQVILLQGILFWLIHLNSYASFIPFWIILPFSSLLFGTITQNSKSILPTLVMHYFYNLFIIIMVF
jgi:membrane protease YdiL (CAAX protease family)